MKKTKNPIETTNPTNFRIKITNTRVVAYPNKLTETDYFGFKVGDLVATSYSTNTIYEVVDIYRDMLSPHDYNVWNSRIARVGYSPPQPTGTAPKLNIIDQKAYDLLEGYKKTGNFGICVLQLKAVLRGAVMPTKPAKKFVKEFDQIKVINYNNLIKVDIEKMLKTKEMQIKRADINATKAVARRDSIEKGRVALEKLNNIYFPKPTAVELDCATDTSTDFEDVIRNLILNS